MAIQVVGAALSVLGDAAKQAAVELLPSAVLGGSGAVKVKMLGMGLSRIESSLVSITSKFEGLEKITFNSKIYDVTAAPFYWASILKTVRDTNKELAIGGKLGESMVKNFSEVGLLSEMVKTFGENAAESMKRAEEGYKDIVNTTGRNLSLTNAEVVELAKNVAVIGKDFDEIADGYMQAGIGIEDTGGRMRDLYVEAAENGLNFKSLSKSIRDNMDAVNKIHFKGGTKAFEKLALTSKKLKLDVKAIVNKSQEMFKDNSLENAVEMSAQLQLLGGDIASIGNPFELFYDLRNDTTAFAIKMRRATESMATFNKTTGEINISPYNMQRLYKMAEITGQSVEDLAKSAKSAQVENQIGDLFDMRLSSSKKAAKKYDSMLKAVANSAKFVDGQWKVAVDNENKAIQDLTEKDIEKVIAVDLDNQEDVYEKLIKSNRTLIASINTASEIMALNVTSASKDTTIALRKKGQDNIENFAESDSFKDFQKYFMENFKEGNDRFTKTVSAALDFDYEKTKEMVVSNVKDTGKWIAGQVADAAKAAYQATVDAIKAGFTYVGDHFNDFFSWDKQKTTRYSEVQDLHGKSTPVVDIDSTGIGLSKIDNKKFIDLDMNKINPNNKVTLDVKVVEYEDKWVVKVFNKETSKEISDRVINKSQNTGSQGSVNTNVQVEKIAK